MKLATVKIIYFYLLQLGERAGAGGVEGGGGGAGGPAGARQTAQVPYHPQINAKPVCTFVQLVLRIIGNSSTIQQNGRESRKLYAVPNKETKPV